LIVLGHSNCGGVQGCIDMCQGKAPELEAQASFVGRWMDILRPKYELVADEIDPDVQARQLEKHAVVISLENLMTFPFIKDRVDQGVLSMHGLWTDIGEGGLECYNPKANEFHKV
jgi:carbonic anhydrase